MKPLHYPCGAEVPRPFTVCDSVKHYCACAHDTCRARAMVLIATRAEILRQRSRDRVRTSEARPS